MLLKGTEQKVGKDKVSTKDEYDLAILGTTADDKKVKELQKLNKFWGFSSLGGPQK